jgi:hypothetical protein
VPVLSRHRLVLHPTRSLVMRCSIWNSHRPIVLTIVSRMPNQNYSDRAELAKRLARMRLLCRDLDSTVADAALQRNTSLNLLEWCVFTRNRVEQLVHHYSASRWVRASQ